MGNIKLGCGFKGCASFALVAFGLAASQNKKGHLSFLGSSYKEILMFQKRPFKPYVPFVFFGMLASQNVFAVTLEELAEQMEQLAAENAELRQKVEKLEAAGQARVGSLSTQSVAAAAEARGSSSVDLLPGETVVRVNHEFSYDMLDPTTNSNRKHLLLLDRWQS